jgi:hypothetical protein
MTREPAPRSRLAVFYVALVVLLGAVLVGVLAAGSDEENPEPIAGGYAVVQGEDCLGATLQLTQSGRYVGAESPDGSLGGQLELEDGRLTGEVECVHGSTAELAATFAEGRLSGRVGDRPIEAELRQDPPELTVRSARLPGSIEGEYELSPRSLCLGGELAVLPATSRWARPASSAAS